MLDIERDPAEQGFTLGSYDLVIASDVLHATRSIADTVQNARSLLATGGMLLVLEVTRPTPYLDLVFDMTSGWWAFEDQAQRPEHCAMSTRTWEQQLPQLDFVMMCSP